MGCELEGDLEQAGFDEGQHSGRGTGVEAGLGEDGFAGVERGINLASKFDGPAVVTRLTLFD